MDDLKHRLKTERTNRKLLQIDLANKLNVSKQTISHWETGQRIPDALTIKILADFFNVTTDYLLCRTNKPLEKPDEIKPEIKILLKNVEDLPLDLINKLNQLVESIKLYKPAALAPTEKPDVNYNIIPERLIINKELLLACK